MTSGESPQTKADDSPARALYRREQEAVNAKLLASLTSPGAGLIALAGRSEAVDRLVRALWTAAVENTPRLAEGICVVAVAGYGRSELFPFSDIDLLFLLDVRLTEKEARDAIRQVTQALWDAGLRASPMTRTLAECDRFDAENVEFTLSLLDRRLIAGDSELYTRLVEKVLPKLWTRERKKIVARLLEMTRSRHRRFGETLFHLEPNIKECPGGVRDIHVCEWLAMLNRQAGSAAGVGAAEFEEFREAREFLLTVRCFLHLRHERDDNTLDWLAQDAAAAAGVGIGRPIAATEGGAAPNADAAYWMRFYFRHARSVERRVNQALEDAAPVASGPSLLKVLRRNQEQPERAFQIPHGRIVFAAEHGPEGDPAQEPEAVLRAFIAMAQTGCRLGAEAEQRLAQALPLLSARLEDGPALWNQLKAILLGLQAGRALRAMHALGILELLLPEFHGIDALVIRDAYHRYTVDEHTFVLIDTLHRLEAVPAEVTAAAAAGIGEWESRFGALLRDLPHPELLYMVALLHDTGKGRNTADHAQESARMAEGVLSRLEIDSYESGMVLSLVRHHLEMPAALRRDVFDTETVRSFAARVPTPEALRMLALFTYADISAVHPDALTPWKAENLWRLYVATANYLDRSVDDERVATSPESELVHRVAALLPEQKERVSEFLEGFPARYVLTRSAEQVRSHFNMATQLEVDPVQLDFRYTAAMSELTLVTTDEPLVFARMAGALAAWGMNIVTADAFSNRQGVIVDSFRFTDSFRTLEMNAGEHTRFLASVHDAIAGTASVEKMLAARRRARRRLPKVPVEARVDFDDSASASSTLLQVVAQDTPGLLHALSQTMSAAGCNIEVALIDTEGEMAIDVFYVTRAGAKLDASEHAFIRQSLLRAMEENARF